MHIILLYLRVVKRVQPELPMHFPYDTGERRFLYTYKKFFPGVPHDLIVVNTGEMATDGYFDDVASGYARCNGMGSDNGAYQSAARKFDCDLMLCFNSIAYFWRPGWLEAFVRAYEKHGMGVYGATASFEQHPHLRTPCIGFHPAIMREYPHICKTRQAAVLFEAGNRFREC